MAHVWPPQIMNEAGTPKNLVLQVYSGVIAFS
jgi:hypothetical protein